MLVNNYIIVTLIVLINVLFIVVGYLFAKVTLCDGVSLTTSRNKSRNISSVENEHITIDDKKFVTEINTNNLEKKFVKLGETQSSTENISSAINKLKGMKG